ncbi:MAG: 50S ribosomal protein L3 [Proteobacteria bacterium]|nr:50S ribosomal protein L3 [Pseudomonadota bacterium]MBU1387734.1 50S ribosomal protein L3 [Pseudomonadota bacterium]MBU1541826.1 50S ribosomal protein L3 [Pseudomonadota bacterium]MBU2429454.1 50S ribosomal protein L3 [Pseudomonadota bacterium]MBU2479775.1 50S ribosomal protein L3 [Pseudomonadota bacterium]
MMSALIGKKIGMTNVFSADGKLVPVTVLQVGPCVVTQIKTVSTDGYNSLQLGFDEKPVGKLNKAMAGHLKKTSDKGFRVLKELRTDDVESVQAGASIGVDIFTVGEKVNVTGITKGRGFQGTVKRHGFSRGPETHGCRNHRKPGSIGNSAWPSRVFKGKKMPGHMGVDKKTVKNLTIMDIRHDENLLLVKGPVPGFKTGVLEVRKAK